MLESRLRSHMDGLINRFDVQNIFYDNHTLDNKKKNGPCDKVEVKRIVL